MTSFDVPHTPTAVWASPNGSVVVDAIGVHHEPVSEAVAYRITSPAAPTSFNHLVLTHLIPAPSSPEQEQAFADEVRSAGFTGNVTVGRDLMCFDVERGGLHD